MAILKDTAGTLARIHQSAPPILLSTMEATGNAPKEDFLTKLFTYTVCIRSNSAFTNHGIWKSRNFNRKGKRIIDDNDEEEEVMVSSWTAEIRQQQRQQQQQFISNDGNHRTKTCSKSSIIHYIITSQLGQEVRILWNHS